MKTCTYGLSLDELLDRPLDLLVLVGAEGEDETESHSESEDEGSEDESEDEEDESGEDENDKSKKKKAEPTPADKKIEALEKEKERHYDRRKTAEAKVTALTAEISQLKKDGVTDEATKTELTTLRDANLSLAAANKKLAMGNAFLQANTHDWNDSAAALKLADLARVEIDDDGTVSGLTSALDKLAKASPWLLKTKVADDKEDPKPRTGDQPVRKPGSAASEAARTAKLRNKYTGLRR